MGNRESLTAEVAIVQRTTRNFNVTGHSVESPAQELYTVALFET